MKFNNYLFRCSELGYIVSKSGKMTQGIQKFLQEKFIEEVYGVRKEAYGRALDKGIACEEDGFKMLGEVFSPGQFVVKQKEPRYNEWIKGTCDTIIDDVIYDVKNAYDLFSFAKAELTWIYQWQLIGYMMLYNKEKSRLFYCLNDMPDYMIMEEQRRMFYFQKKWATVDDTEYLKACDELESAHKYGHMPIEERFKVWDVLGGYDDAIMIAVEDARAYMNTLWNEHNERIELNKKLMQKNTQ